MLPRPRLNNQIRVPQVRLIDETGTSVGIVDIKTALEMAYEKKLDLVEISPKAVPPVARIIDFGKFQYQQEKQLRKQKTKHKAAGLKLIKISLGIAENDAMIKIKKLVEFLESGHKVKVDMFLRGRERANKDFAEEKFKKFLLMIAVPYKTEQSLKKLPTGFNVVLSR
ncbi:translation initiation factor IF-3 [Candidatus Azambacteria bacterium RIFCSPHIGHO2_02_FULL_52_12]|uniref:Translation initiation factor IF-3 n=1 Tax=Candidatus Azambacteria bacterium RIFCSPLOWO2_01_FULL_46_25 TaxID=1797298 RepID=A0A1F5BW36_9BACT|nr:MAG: translation initiation factor IF-3 [Candidatus Azambacteria bacterium RIFCSPHIGHO2_02_FULL_52_12]OGD34824.1 MAG: translation initiation factor IF-3 [Candidatus Azambacteria bacterium RIFCSPLOWO2_01_FULL_46_25]OGD37399.1 MAG: translation initiation factor IF-3 [Candidatus Azambacteria bacterium RIFCSPHIGHO2_01_FULL_51_74]